MTLEEAKNNIGAVVKYIPFEGCDSSQIEYGEITSVNDKYVFVRYGRKIHGEATRPEDLKFWR